MHLQTQHCKFAQATPDTLTAKIKRTFSIDLAYSSPACLEAATPTTSDLAESVTVSSATHTWLTWASLQLPCRGLRPCTPVNTQALQWVTQPIKSSFLQQLNKCVENGQLDGHPTLHSVRHGRAVNTRWRPNVTADDAAPAEQSYEGVRVSVSGRGGGEETDSKQSPGSDQWSAEDKLRLLINSLFHSCFLFLLPKLLFHTTRLLSILYHFTLTFYMIFFSSEGLNLHRFDFLVEFSSKHHYINLWSPSFPP